MKSSFLKFNVVTTKQPILTMESKHLVTKTNLCLRPHKAANLMHIVQQQHDDFKKSYGMHFANKA